MLAYLFWHTPATAIEAAEYERLLAIFHARLREEPPAGFRASAAFAVSAPWIGDGYEDWYLVDDWSALGVLNAAAVDAAHRPQHDPVAGAAGRGAGGVYALRAGDLDVRDARSADWSAKPPGRPYPDWEAGLVAGRDPAGFALWQRQLVLGPAPEYCSLSAAGDARRVA